MKITPRLVNIKKIGLTILAIFMISTASTTIVLEAVGAEASNNPTAQEILKKYGENMDKWKSCVIKTEYSCEGDAHFSKEVSEYWHVPRLWKLKLYSSAEVSYDGKRAAIRFYRWGNFRHADPILKEEAQFEGYLWDGNVYYRYGKTYGEICNNGQKNKIAQRDKFAITYLGNRWGDKIFGRFGSQYTRIDEELQEAMEISVRKRMEMIQDSECYVIDAKTKYGDYEMWFDPNHGYNIAQAVLKRGPGNIKWKNHHRTQDQRVVPEDENDKSVIKNIAFQNVDGVWVPLSYDVEDEWQYGKNSYGNSLSNYKITEITINPDHEALQSFVPHEIENGAEVSFGHGGYSQAATLNDGYIWEDGIVIPNIDIRVTDLEGHKRTFRAFPEDYIPIGIGKGEPTWPFLLVGTDIHFTQKKSGIFVTKYDGTKKPEGDKKLAGVMVRNQEELDILQKVLKQHTKRGGWEVDMRQALVVWCDYPVLEDVVKLEEIEKVTSLHLLSKVESPDLTPIKDVHTLRSLVLDDNPNIADISALSENYNLRHLRIRNCVKITDVSPLKDLIGLESLYLWNTGVSDLTPLQNLLSLQKLHISSELIDNLTPLKDLPLLRDLIFDGNLPIDLSPLQNLTTLESIRLSCPISGTLEPLSGLNKLRKLELVGPGIPADLSPLFGLKKLEKLHLINVPVSEEQVEQIKEAIPGLKVKYVFNETEK